MHGTLVTLRVASCLRSRCGPLRANIDDMFNLFDVRMAIGSANVIFASMTVESIGGVRMRSKYVGKLLSNVALLRFEENSHMNVS